MSETGDKKRDGADLEIAELEERFPELAGKAFAAAAQRSLDAGQSVTQTACSQVVRISPDGRRTVVKEIHPRIAVQAGSKIRIK